MKRYEVGDVLWIDGTVALTAGARCSCSPERAASKKRPYVFVGLVGQRMLWSPTYSPGEGGRWRLSKEQKSGGIGWTSQDSYLDFRQIWLLDSVALHFGAKLDFLWQSKLDHIQASALPLFWKWKVRSDWSCDGAAFSSSVQYQAPRFHNGLSDFRRQQKI